MTSWEVPRVLHCIAVFARKRQSVASGRASTLRMQIACKSGDCCNTVGVDPTVKPESEAGGGLLRRRSSKQRNAGSL